MIGTIELVDVDYPHHIYLSPDRSTLLVAVPGADLSGGHSGGGHGGHGDAGGDVVPGIGFAGTVNVIGADLEPFYGSARPGEAWCSSG